MSISDNKIANKIKTSYFCLFGLVLLIMLSPLFSFANENFKQSESDNFVEKTDQKPPKEKSKESPEEASQAELPSILKADKVDGDKISNTLNAFGNVELSNGSNLLLSNELSYNKDLERIYAKGNVKIKNYDLGNLSAASADMKSDFSDGDFNDATIVFNDGSYIKSPKISRIGKEQTLFNKPIFSICPNPDINKDNKLAGEKLDMLSIKSKTTLIDKEDGSIKTKHGIFRLYNFPILYTPYLSTPLPSSERKSGFLRPSYLMNTKLGKGIRIPYYFNIAPDKDLTTTLQAHPFNGHLILENEYRQILKEGEYYVNLEIANNESKSNGIVGSNTRENTQSLRWRGRSEGDFKLSKTIGLEFDINHAGDKNYPRDYKNSFEDHTLSTINLDYIKDKEYASAKTVSVQELGVNQDEKTAPTALPILTYYNETNPQGGIFNQTYSLLANTTIISRESGLQYRRASLKPTIKIPYNINGNLFEISGSVQGDFYNLENNYTTSQRDNNFDSAITNYRPEANFKWSLPMVNKLKKSTIIIEPLATFAISSYGKNFLDIPNEDSNDTELTQGNLFLSDRFVGFDRNEAGQRASYGFKSHLFNDYGQFGLGLGQSIRLTNKEQDVVIRGFNNSSKSNIVGELSYKTKKVFSIIYGFQLNESNYRNDINEITTSLNFERFNINSNYIFIRKTVNNADIRKQIGINAEIELNKRFTAVASMNRDLVTGRTITRSYGINYNGCCVVSGISITETNVSALVKPEKSYKINFVIKNL
jgi:LPS-assembly protein